jgi:hypothetical protein
MGSSKHRWLCFAVGLSLLTAGFLSTGCRTVGYDSLFTTSGPGWHVQQGQALWRPGRNYPELGGEVVLASHQDGRCAVQFVKTPIPLMLAQTSSTHWLIEFPPRRMRFAGKGNPPSRFLWLHLRAALAGESLPEVLHFSRKSDGGWELDNTKSGETLEGYLEP